LPQYLVSNLTLSMRLNGLRVCGRVLLGVTYKVDLNVLALCTSIMLILNIDKWIVAKKIITIGTMLIEWVIVDIDCKA
jgi:hypothetical protein